MAIILLQRAPRHQIPPETNLYYHLGEKVLIWSKKILANHIGEWVGTFKLSHTEDARKLAHVKIYESNENPFNITQRKHQENPVEAYYSFLPFPSLSSKTFQFLSWSIFSCAQVN